ncbi:MAG: hypothetical protein ABEL97_00805 [Salinibacter sp.]
MIDLVLAVLCSVSIGMIFKHTGRRGIDRTTLLTVNYAAAVAVAVALILFGERTAGGVSLSPALLGLAGGVGTLLIAGFFLLSYATDVAGMALAIGVMRVSVVVPFLASWLVWEEVPSLPQGVGMGLAAVAFFLIAQKHRPPSSGRTGASSPSLREKIRGVDGHAFLVLALTFLAGGGVDLSMKAFQEGFGDGNSRVLFLLLAFGAAFVVGALVVGIRGLWLGRWPAAAAIGWGVLLGVVNYGSLEFLLRAIADLPGPFVFPANNIAIMILAAGLGVAVWNERLTLANRWGLGLAGLALVLLRL